MAFKFGSTNISAFKYGATPISRLYQGSTQIWSAASDPTALLLRFNGSDSSTTFVNEAPSGAAVTPYGGAQISTTVSKFGGSSAFFNGYDAYLEASCAINWANDFTIEFWFYRAGTSSQGIDTLFEAGNIQGGQGGLHIYVDSNGDFFANDGFVAAIAGGSAPISSWVHVAFVRASGTNTLYVDGVAVGTSQQDFSTTVTNNTVRIGGAPNYGFYAYGYIDEFRLLTGVALYTSDFTPSELPFGAQVSLLMHFDGSNGSQTFVDSSSNALTVTASSTAQINSTQSKFGGASLLCNASDDRLTISDNPNLNFGTGDFTVECWLYMTGSFGCPFSKNGDDDWSAAYGWELSNTYTAFFVASGAALFGPAIPQNQWVHLAAVRNNGTCTLYIDGVSVASQALPGNLSNVYDLTIGNRYITSQGGWCRLFPGYIDELRIIKGYAAYTSDFTPPDLPFGAELSLLVNFEDADPNTGAPNDSSPNAHALTVSGNVYTLFSTTQSKFGTSGYFDDSTYLNVPAHPSLNLGDGDFTIDMWAWLPANGTYTGNTGTIFSNGGTGSNTFALFWNPAYGFGNNVASGAANINSLSLFVGNTYLRAESVANAPQLDAWNHIAIVRRAGVINFYLNGQSMSFAAGADGTFTAPIDLAGWALSGLAIGYDVGQTGGNDFFGYLDEFRIVKGYAAYTDNFTPPTLPFGTNAALLMHFDGNFNDSSPAAATFTASGNAAIANMGGYFGGGAYFDGVNSFISTPVYSDLSFGNGDFTVEAWVYRLSGEDRFRIAGLGAGPNGSSPPDTTGWTLWIRDQGYVWFYRYDGTTETYFASTSQVPENQWTHVAVTRVNGLLQIFINGVSVGSATTTPEYDHVSNADPDANLFYVGAIREAGSWRYTYGYVDELRIVKGYAAYTSNFTLPSAPF